MSITKKLMREVSKQDISNGKIPFFEEYFTDCIRFNTKRGHFSDTLNLGVYLDFIKFNVNDYKRALKKRVISKNISFSDYLLIGRKVDCYKIQELKAYMNKVTVSVDEEEDDED